MRYITLILACALAFAASVARGQSLDAFKRRLAEPTTGSALFDPARVTVCEHGDAGQVVAEAAKSAQRLSYKGYRVCIFFDNGPDARSGAMAAKNLFEETFPGTKVYMVYLVLGLRRKLPLRRGGRHPERKGRTDVSQSLSQK